MTKNRLLDVAEVRHGNGDWMRGGDRRDGLESSVEVFLVDSCDLRAEVSLLAGADPSGYTVSPFGIVAELSRPLQCTPADAESWLVKALGEGNEYSLTRALVVEQIADTQNWVGAEGVTQVDIPQGGALGDAVLLARAAWFAKTLSSESYQPVMHVAPEAVPVLLGAHLLTAEVGGGVSSPFGDDVVVGDGYSIPQVFFTGPITIDVSTPELVEGSPILFRNNRVQITANQMAAIDVSPLDIIRIGDMPGGEEEPPV